MGRGVLRPDLAATHFRLGRHAPPDALAPFVDYYWIPRWDLRGKPPYEQAILPHPNVNLVFEASGAAIFGVDRRLFARTLSGREQVAALVSHITDDPRLRRVDQLSASSGMTPRTLQRLFADYVGVSPKWVMRRARLHEAAERADSGEPVDWALLASDLGYADQAHLTRDFTVTIGVPPSRYAAAPLPGSLTGTWWAWVLGVGLGLDYHGDDHGAAAVVVADPFAHDAAG
jgi:AraC-like DNA-binding protein